MSTPRRTKLGWPVVLAASLLGCGGDDERRVAAAEGTQALMDFRAGAAFHAAPFPSEHRRTATGGVDLTGFPNPGAKPLVDVLLGILARDADGFGVSSGVFFTWDGSLDATSLPTLDGSVLAGATAFLIGVDPASPDYLHRYPITAAFEVDPGPFGAPNELVLLPLQGVPLRPRTAYAAVVTTAVRDASGAPVSVAPAMRALAAGQRPDGLGDAAFAAYEGALAALDEAGVDRGALAAVSAFTTGAPEAAMGAFRADALARGVPAPEQAFVRHEVFDDYCVYESTIRMPVYQHGAPPFQAAGGGFELGPDGLPLPATTELARFVVTLPRRAMPASGFPVVVFSRTGGGGERPLVDRGVHAVAHGEATAKGEGPALGFARAGFAGVTIDGPHGGLRNVTKGDEQFLMFNIENPLAMRDNVREAALELIVTAHLLDDVTIAAADCAGLTTAGGAPARFDTGTMAVMGHSMGATIAPLALAFEPRFRAGILSGAGGSYIENVVHKQSPLVVHVFAELLLGYTSLGIRMREHDPVLSLLQWAAEPADPPAYARRVVREPEDGPPRSVLMLQGIVDTYILPPIANALSLSLGLDLAGPALDGAEPRLAAMTPLAALLPFSGAKATALPAGGNATSIGGELATAVVVQHAEDGVEDGHEVVFQTAAPKHQYRCFLETLAKGAPSVPVFGGAEDACP